MKYSIIILLFIFLISCNYQNLNSEKTEIKNEKVETINDFPFYLVGDPYYIDNVKYVPKVDYKYSETGQASFYGKKYHGKKSDNNEIINVTELLASHKTLPLPSLVKITNEENGISIIARVNARIPSNNSDIIIVSLQAAKLLDFYKEKVTKVKVEILEDESKKLMNVSKSIINYSSNEIIDAAPTIDVKIENID